MPPRKRPFRADTGTVDAPIFSRASVLDNGLIGVKPVSKSSLTPRNGFPDPTEATDDLYALNSLQLRRTRHIEPSSLIHSVYYLVDCLPRPVQRQIATWSPGTPEVFNCPQSELPTRAQEEYGNDKTFWDNIKRSEYFIWPIEAEPTRFVTAIFHLRKGLKDDPNFSKPNPSKGVPEKKPPKVQSDEFTMVEGWSVVDPIRSEEARQRVNRVKARIRRIFDIEGIRFRRDSYRERVTNTDKWALPWVRNRVPPQTDEWSSGLRSFALIRQLFQRIVDFYCHETGYQDSLFDDDTSGWLNADQVLHEMIGICAINCLDDMDYKARIAIEVIGRISSLEAIPEFDASALRPTTKSKTAYVPGSDDNGGIRTPIDVQEDTSSSSSEEEEEDGNNVDGDDNGGDDDGNGSGNSKGSGKGKGKGKDNSNGNGNGEGNGEGEGDDSEDA